MQKNWAKKERPREPERTELSFFPKILGKVFEEGG